MASPTAKVSIAGPSAKLPFGPANTATASAVNSGKNKNENENGSKSENENDTDEEYKAVDSQYSTLESRIAWDVLCGGNRHFGYYESPTRWWTPAFPIGPAQQRMQSKLLQTLGLGPGSHVLDAGCGDGHVAIDLATRGGLRITGFDVVERHVRNARRNALGLGLGPDRVDIRRLGFEQMASSFEQGSFDGVYTSESLLHAARPDLVVRRFWDLLRPGGRLVLHEYHNDYVAAEDGGGQGFPSVIARDREDGDTGEAFVRCERYFRDLLERAGFGDVAITDYSQNIEPMARLLSVSAVARHLVRWLRLQRFFPNSAARDEGYVGRQHWAYVSASGTKPAVRPGANPGRREIEVGN